VAQLPNILQLPLRQGKIRHFIFSEGPEELFHEHPFSLWTFVELVTFVEDLVDLQGLDQLSHQNHHGHGELLLQVHIYSLRVPVPFVLRRDHDPVLQGMDLADLPAS